MIENDNRELLKLLQACQIMEKIKKMWGKKPWGELYGETYLTV